MPLIKELSNFALDVLRGVKSIPAKEVEAEANRLLTAMKEAGFISKPVHKSGTPLFNPAESYPRQVSLVSEKAKSEDVLRPKSSKVSITGEGEVGRMPTFPGSGAIAPGMKGSTIFKDDANAALQAIHAEQVVHEGIRLSTDSMSAILMRVPGIEKESTKEILELMKPLAEKRVSTEAVWNYNQMMRDTERKHISTLQKQIEKKGSKLTQDAIDEINYNILERQVKIAGYEKEMARVKPDYDSYKQEAISTFDMMSQKFAKARIMLGLDSGFAKEGGLNYEKYPFLKGRVTAEEEDAIAALAFGQGVYKTRLEERGMRVMESAHAPYVSHPAASEKRIEELAKAIGDKEGYGLPFTKWYSRAKGSFMTVLDPYVALPQYYAQTELRMAATDFWKDWKHIANATKNNPAIPEAGEFWKQMEKVMIPQANTTMTKAANMLYGITAFDLIAFGASTPVKHGFKLLGDWSIMGISRAKNVPSAVVEGTKQFINDPVVSGILGKIGIKPDLTKTAVGEITSAVNSAYRGRKAFYDIGLHEGITNLEVVQGRISNIMSIVASVGSLPIKWVEYIDRALTAKSVIDIVAGKPGMTAQQAMYNTLDMTMKTNFYGGYGNAAWMRNPYVRAIFPFQVTPFKIFERRLITGIRTGQAVYLAAKEVLKTPAAKEEMLKELQGLGRYVKQGEKLFKEQTYVDFIKAARSLKDNHGIPFVDQFVRDALLAGAVIYGGGKLLDSDFTGHVGHLPFIKAGEKELTVPLSPVAHGVYRTLTQSGEDKDGFFVSRFIKNYLGQDRIAPAALNKWLRISKDDIPEIYRDSKLRYLFALPAKKEE